MLASVFIGISLDGFIARENGDLDWLPGAEGGASDGEEHGYPAFIATVDTIVIGRGTYEKVLTFDAWPYKDQPVVVLTGKPESLQPPPVPTVTVMGGTPAEIVARLRERGARHLYIDGGVTIQRFLAAGLIQRIIITRIPVIIGRGIPLFGPVPRDIRLRHVSTRALPSGMVQSEYEVV
jgi:dihydrofolate reductase